MLWAGYGVVLNKSVRESPRVCWLSPAMCAIFAPAPFPHTSTSPRSRLKVLSVFFITSVLCQAARVCPLAELGSVRCSWDRSIASLCWLKRWDVFWKPGLKETQPLNNTTFAARCLNDTTHVCCVWRQQIVDLSGTPYVGIDIEYMLLYLFGSGRTDCYNDYPCFMNFVPCCKPYGRIQLWVYTLKTPLLSTRDMFSDDAQVFQMWRQMKPLWH